MKQILLKDLEQNESYLIKTGYDWSPSGYDIAEFNNGELLSQSNGSCLVKENCIETIYVLPE